MTEPSPPPYINPPTSMSLRITEEDLRVLRPTAHAARDAELVMITGRQLRALLLDHAELVEALKR